MQHALSFFNLLYLVMIAVHVAIFINSSDKYANLTMFLVIFIKYCI